MTQPNSDVTIGLGGGCHWCTEAVFASLEGVTRVDQGFVRSDPPFDTWSEAVRIKVDTSRLPLRVLIDVHLRTHASTSNHKMRGKYRSAVYVFSQEQAAVARAALNDLQRDFDTSLVTQVLPLRSFRFSDPRFHRYFEQHEGGPFCTRYIDPKLAFIRDRYEAFTA